MLTRRVHVLFDDARFSRIEREAKSRKVSVAEVIREAVDYRFPRALPSRREAGDLILGADPVPVPDDPGDLKREIADARDRFDR
jgi:hypothetical protein